MKDIGVTAIVVSLLVLITAGVATTHTRRLRPWLWLAFGEYALCAIVQYSFGVDSQAYRRDGLELARLLDEHFGWASYEVTLLLFQKPNSFDTVIIGAGTNTGSMSAAAGWLTFLVRGSPYAAQALIAGASLFGAHAIFVVFRDECPDVSPRRLFVATVLFPSIAFWTASLHKESFCVVGIGCVFAAWRAARRRRARSILYGALGFALIALFRAPALPPLLLGLVLYFVLDRVRRARGAQAAVLGPAYILLGFAVLALGMIFVTRISPNLALDRLADSVADQQRAWSLVEGGSTFAVDEPTEQSLGTQLLSAPLGLANALLRPQLFDVRSPLMLISALEMTVVAALLIRAIVVNGPGGILRRIQSSPFLLMCATIAIVGLTFVGLTTRNFGSMARYRVPFLPFYGSLLAILVMRPTRATQPQKRARPPLKPSRRSRTPLRTRQHSF